MVIPPEAIEEGNLANECEGSELWEKIVEVLVKNKI